MVKERTQEVFDRIVEAHHAVRRFARRAEVTDDPAELRALLDKLSGLLSEHFSYEERGFRRIKLLASVDPVQAEARMRADHAVLLRALGQLLGSSAADAGWVQEVRDFAQLLLEHERFESALVRSDEP